MLTSPARSRPLNNLADLLLLPEEATIGTMRWSSMREILERSTDSNLQGNCNLLMQTKFSVISL